MRRVETEGDSQSSRRRSRGVARSSLAQKPHLRRLALEGLEDRTLMSTVPKSLASTLPSPVTTGQSFVGGGLGGGLTGAPNSSSPSVAVDPLDPSKLIAAWVTYDAANKLDGGNGQVTTYVQGAYSIDGGVSWNTLPHATDADIQPDFSVTPPSGSPQPNFPQTTDATVAFGRDEQAYLLTSTHGATSGVLDLQRWDFTTASAAAAPVAATWAVPAYDQLSGFSGNNTLNPIYRWQGADSAVTPTLAVDNNVPFFSDGTTTQSDPFVGNVYVAWQTVDTAPKGVTNYNPDTIKLMSSSDQGQDFTYQAYLNNSFGQAHSPGSNFDSPRIAISQGSPTVTGGQVNIVYDNAGSANQPAPYYDLVGSQASTTGGTDTHADSPRNDPIGNAIQNGGGQGIDTPITTNIPIPVSVTDPKFSSVQNLVVTISLEYPTLGNTSAVLIAPDGTRVTLWNTATNAAGQAVNMGSSLSGANVGASAYGPYIGTTLDSTAFRSIFDGNVTAPYTGHFQPLGNLQRAFQGRNASAINGTWTLAITDFRFETATTPRRLIGASLDFTSGHSDLESKSPTVFAQTFLNSGTHTFTDGIQGVPVLPDPAIASDNTLGSHSPHQGRLYVALADDNFNAVSRAYTTSTFIELYTSDDGGASWSYAGIVNDDSGVTDGFSTGGYAQPGSGINSTNPQLAFLDPRANVRPKIEPQVAVDPYTGTLVVSFLDTRNDASAVRVANYIAASTDGGTSFAPEVYANPSANLYNSPVIDAITGKQVNLGPIPDNESSGNNNREGTFGFGQRQGLAVANGHIIPVWSSNQNGTSSNGSLGSTILNAKSYLEIQSAVLTFAAGPRVVASTQGPVGEPGDSVNATRAADGSPIANTIVLTFDRAVDPASFPADGATIGSSPLQVFYNNPSGTPSGVPLRVLTVSHDATDTVYTVTFDPANHGVGTYSYTLQPLVRGQIPYQTSLGAGSTTQVPFIDTAVNNGQSSFTVSGHGNIQLTTATLLAQADIYQKGTSTGSPTDLQIFLIAQDGTQYLLYSATTQGQAADVGFDVSNTISIPAIPVELLDQTYTIKVVDNVPGEKVFVYNNVNTQDFNFQVQLSNQGQSGLSGNLLDQNANGVPGDPSDAYSIPVGRGTLPLIVPGPHVTTTSVNGANGIISTGSDNLVTNYDPSSINVTFDRTMQVSSFTPDKVLSIVGPTGRIDGAQNFPSTGTSKTFAYNGTFQFIPKSGTLTSSILIANTGLNVSNLSVKVNVTDPTDASLAMSLVAPDGTTVPLVLAGSAAGANFTNTVFSDAPAVNGLNLTIPGAPAGSAAPYSLTYKPAMPLSALAGKAIDGTWKLTIADSTAGGPQGRLNAWSLNITPQVPEGPGTKLDSTLVVSSFPDNSFKIAHLAVLLNISSTKDSDLQVSLVAPDGTTTVPLILNAGGTGANFTNTILDDGATIPIAQGAAPFSLSYKPASPLSALNGLSLEGTWTLRIVNPNADGSVTTLNSWSLIATPQLTVTPVSPVAGGATTFTIGFPTQKLSGTYAVTLSPNIVSVTPDPADPTTGAPLDTNLNAGVDALRGTSNGVTTTENFAATSVPVAIPYAKKLPIGPIVPGILNSQINVTDNFAIQGDVGTLAGLTVSLNISYYFDPDLTATLTAPNGKSVTLFMNVGKGVNTADFTNTTLSDTTTPPAPITAAGAPFFGTFNPQQPLSNFTTDTVGNQAFSGGLWTLTINDQGLDPGPGVDKAHPPALLSWSLAFQKPQTNTGLGEPVADQKTVSFRLFNIAPSDPLANDTWTAVGPAGTVSAGNSINFPTNPGGVNLGGPVTAVALDPSDPSGNTAYVGASSGGVWKTTNFLTTATGGPTYVPLTDFGANYTVNIGGIAIFSRNNDPRQSIVFAGTGNGQATTANNGNSVQGVGILRSVNGGANFTLLDSSVNVDAAGNPLPINSPLRDHAFVGSTTYKVVVDPTPLPGGGVIVYAALGGKNGGLWRSIDGGDTWQNLSAGVVPQVNGQNAAATDVLLDPVSTSPSTGSLDILYAAFQGVGVFISTNRGQALSELFGTVGATNLIQNSVFAPAVPLTVNDANTPNGAFGRIILAKPALTNSAAQNANYQDWLYAAVENTDGTFRGLYITKDRGENWTKAQIASVVTPPTVNAVTQALPTNDNTVANNFDVTNGATIRTHNGNSAFSMAVDPLDPNIVYLGGTQDYQTSGLIRVDLTGIYDAHAWVPFANDRNDGGKLTVDSTGRAVTNNIALGIPFYQGTNPGDFNQQTGDYYVNLRHDPTSPFNTSATLFVANSNSFLNDGTGVKWTPLDARYLLPMQGSTNVHQLLPVLDPLTGLTRLIISDDQGVFTGLFNADGTLDTGGIGTAATVNGSRNGNLQDEALYSTAAQPSTLAAQAAGALFYGSGIGMTNAESAPDLLSTGNLTWTVLGPSYGDLQNVLGTNDRGGVGVATDPTGGVSAGGPSSYEFDVPLLGGDTTNFFRVKTSGHTTGLVNNYTVEFPANGAIYNGVIPLGSFTVNPINGSQILISSTLGNVYETTNKGTQWLQIGAGQAVGGAKADFDGTYAPALTYGAPDPGARNGVGNLNNFVYVGTVGGHIYVTQTGAGPWASISNGLDGSSIVSIFTSPNRGSHEAYAVTLKGVYYMANSIASPSNPTPTWVNISGNLSQIQHSSFGDPTLAENSLLNYGNGQLGGFRSIVADYRYAVPDPVTPTTTYPVLYVAGYGGVFRSLDNGSTWTAFPDTAFDSAPADGGYLPNVDVTGLQLNLGAINPATGHATQVTGDPEVLLASTLGRGDFAIRLAPNVFPSTIHFDSSLPAPNGSDSGVSNTDRITNVLTPYLDGISEISNYGNTVTITLTDASNGKVIGTGTTDQFGRFSIQIVNDGTDPSFFRSSTALNDKVVGIQATDSSGARGNVTLFAYTLDTIIPATPAAPVLEALYDTGRSSSDDKTNLSVPAQVAPGAPLTIVAPVFDVATPLPPANPLTPNPLPLTVELLRATSPNGPFTVVATAPGGFKSPVMITDTSLATLVAAAPINQTFYYEADQVDVAGNVSTPISGVLAVTVDTIAPAAPTGLTLDPSTNTGPATPPLVTSNIHPLFDVTGLLPNDQLFLYRSLGSGAPILVGTAAVGAAQVADQLGATVDGVYVYSVAQQDVYGNFSLLSGGLTLTINTQAAPGTPVLLAGDDTGRSSSDNITNIAVPAPTPGSTPNFVPPIFSVTAATPPAGQPAVKTVELLRSASPNGPFTVVGNIAFNGNPALVGDTTVAALAKAGPLNTTFYYEADQVNAAGIRSKPSGVRAVTYITTTPPSVAMPTLDPSTNSGLNKSQNITNFTHPLFDVAGVAPDDNLELFRSIGGSTPVLVGTGAVGSTQVMDTAGVPADGVYVYSAAQVDIAGNISTYSLGVVITINTQLPAAPTIVLFPADDSGAPTHPDVTNVRTPRLSGTGTPGLGIVILSVTGSNYAQGTPITPSVVVAQDGTYLAQVTNPLPDNVYTLVARTINAAGNISYSAPLTVTIKANGPQILPTLSILPADNTGLKNDAVTANRRPHFIGVTDRGVTVNLYSLTNNQLSAPLATTTSSAVDGSFQLQLPLQLSNGNTQLVAQASDVAGNKGLLSPALNLRIVTTAGDYTNSGAAQFSVYQPANETYYVLGVGTFASDTTPGRDVPVQYDINGDGKVDGAGDQFDTATYVGPLSSGARVNFQFGNGRLSMPVSGYYDASGTFDYALYNADTAKWAIYLPRPGGEVLTWGVPRVDVPAPAAYDGNGVTEIATFRPSAVNGVTAAAVSSDADSFNVVAPNFSSNYQVSFTDPAVLAKGFVYKAGDIPAPADYDGIGKDEFAIYRPTTGQFFILKVPNLFDKTTWTLRTVTLNLPGGPKVGDQPVSQDYEGTGKASPTVYRPSNATFYEIQSTNGIQRTVQFGQAGVSVASAGPVNYRLSALTGPYVTSAGGGTVGAITAGGGLHADALAGTTTSTGVGSSQILPGSSTIALAMPAVVTTPAPAAPTATAPTSSASIPLGFAGVPAPAVAATASAQRVTLGATTPKVAVKAAVASRPTDHAVAARKSSATARPAHKAATPAKPLTVTTPAHPARPAAHPDQHHAAVAAALVHLAPIRKGRHEG